MKITKRIAVREVIHFGVKKLFTVAPLDHDTAYKIMNNYFDFSFIDLMS